MPDSREVLIAIPMYCCESQIARVVNDLNPAFPVLMIDNQSTDHTLANAISALEQRARTDAKVIQNENNFGLGGSQITAIQYAIENGFKWLVVLHGDHQADPRQVDQLLEYANQYPEVDVVLGSRFMKGSKRIRYSLRRNFGNRILNAIYSLFTGKKIEDLGSGLNAFKVDSLKKIPYQTLSCGFDFNMDLLLTFITKAIKFEYYPISWRVADEKSNARDFKVGLLALRKLIFWKWGIQEKRNPFIAKYQILFSRVAA